jgi:hypothetical protein
VLYVKNINFVSFTRKQDLIAKIVNIKVLVSTGEVLTIVKVNDSTYGTGWCLMKADLCYPLSNQYGRYLLTNGSIGIICGKQIDGWGSRRKTLTHFKRKRQERRSP